MHFLKLKRYAACLFLAAILVLVAACKDSDEAPKPISPGWTGVVQLPALTRAEAAAIKEEAERFGLPVDDMIEGIVPDQPIVNVKVYTGGASDILMERNVEGVIDSIRFGYVTRVQLY